MKPILNVALCKTAGKYSLHGVLKEESNLFAANSAPQNLIDSELQSVTDDQHAAIKDNVQPSSLFVVHTQPQTARTAREEQVETEGHHGNLGRETQSHPLHTVQSRTEFIAKCISQGYTLDMLMQNFFASIATVYQADFDTRVSQGLLIPIFINTVCLTYTQYKLIIDGFIKARTGQFNSDNSCEAPSIINQLQAFAGLLSAIETGIRSFFNIMVVVNSPHNSFKYVLATISGLGMGGSRLMASAHAACDIPLGKTLVGKLVYSILTSPLMFDFTKFTTIVTPAILGITYFSAITTVKDNLEMENQALSALTYTLAIFSGMMGFLMQKSYCCEVIENNVRNNVTSVQDWNKFWYGETDNSNILQMSSHAIKRFIEILFTVPLTTLNMMDHLLSVFCYFVLALLPIQIVALCQYISQPTLTYLVYYQMFHNTQGLIKTYTAQDTSPLTSEQQFHATIAVAMTFGLASAFTLLNLTVGNILEDTNKVYSGKVGLLKSGTDMRDNTLSTTSLLPPEETFQSGLYNRLNGAVTITKKSIITVFTNMIDQIKGKAGLRNV